LFSALYYIGCRNSRERRMSVRGFVRTIFARRVILHPSSLVDLRLWVLNGIVFASAYGLIAFGLFFWRDRIDGALVGAFGAHAPTPWPAWTVMTMATALQLLTYELAYWFGHHLFHKVPALWEFHKVHHSAEVLTPLTELRQHPVEIIVMVNLIGLATGATFGAMTYAFGPGVQPFTLLNGNILTMMFLLTYGHLRHSHMWIPFTGVTGRVLQSPAHHQLHHSANPAHFDKNLGFALAVWDWAFGTHAIPARTREPIVFGVGNEGAPFRSTLSALAAPCARFASHTLRLPQRASPRDVVGAAQTPPT
jgi:sterol desaturase/sphingolipid hydroxylase (fatty acid hydroxylase superfamily)